MAERCVRHEQPARVSIVMPSGPLAPKVEQKRPTFETLPSFMNGARQTALSRVIATNSTDLARIEHQAVGADAGVDQAIEPAVGCQPIDPPGRIVQAGLALVGEIDVAIGGDMQIVAAPERIRNCATRQHRLHPPCPRVEFHDAVPVVGDQDAPVAAIFSPLGQPSYSITSDHFLSGAILKMRPNGISTM